MPIPFAIPECRIGTVVEQRLNHLTIEVLPDAKIGRCPECCQASRSVHSRYHRYLADLPISTSQTTLDIEVRRFYCSNPCCSPRTFAEPMRDLIESRARRTRRLAETQGLVGIACGGAPGARLVRAMPAPAVPAPVHVGVDDWAMRKGCGYGTIVVDLERHRVVDLPPTAPQRRWPVGLGSGLASRSLPVTADRVWPRGQPRRSRALQVADRWHLLASGTCYRCPDQRLRHSGEIALSLAAHQSARRNYADAGAIGRRAGRNGQRRR